MASRQLYVTAAGMTVADTAHVVSDMAGHLRVPNALKRANRLTPRLKPPDR